MAEEERREEEVVGRAKATISHYREGAASFLILGGPLAGATTSQ